ncbi:uncharacterized protein LOC124112966 [Haliotis rufescens]|uniref:uncharacterized protein LOC124112966 n=1 Tax=Haliotis rufescens TaxID=6454 RepID=UPI001EB07AC9|nr:uncharacterized protein LOC124112966 [Haliotis rufescens]
MALKSTRRRQLYISVLLTCMSVSLCALYLQENSVHEQVHVEVVPVTSPTGQITSLLNKSDHFVVPNIVHFVWFGEDLKFRFHHLLSIKSAYSILKPDRILFHCNHKPVGKWWKVIKQTIPILRIVDRKAPTEIYGNMVIRSEHKSDIARIQILQKYGGIYMDTDVIALKSFNPLRHYGITMGIEYHGTPGRLNNGIIVSAPNATFLSLWLNTYRNFSKREWDYHDSIIPYYLQFTYPHLIHVEEKTLNYPSGLDINLIYKDVYDWSRNYAMHLWYRLYDTEHGPTGIKTMNTTFGQIARYIYYGTRDILK